MPDGNYDISTLKIDPQALAESAQRLDTLGNGVADSVLRIGDVMSGLALSWVGGSSEEAQQFSDRWKRVMTEMFGDKDSKTYGVLPVMAGGLKAAAVGFSHVEIGLEKFFKDFSDALHSASQPLHSGGSGGGDDTPKNQGDSNSATTEKFPS